LPVTRGIRVAIHDEHEIFRRGLCASLESEDGVTVVATQRPWDSHDDIDVAVVSALVVRDHRLACPLVLCVGDLGTPRTLRPGNVVAGVLHRSTLTEEQLHAAVWAAAAGLRINAEAFARVDPGDLGPRAVQVLDLLADGHSTREIAGSLSYSERAIKKHIHDLERRLGARSRAQVVAQAIRQGII
jgi:DNA-binding NarL/FixJ family response regulator